MDEIRKEFTDEDLLKVLQKLPTQIRKIEFEKPITLNPGDSFRVNFLYTKDGLKCDVILETADGRRIVIGEKVEDVIEHR